MRGQISDLENQYGDPKKVGGIPLPTASFGGELVAHPHLCPPSPPTSLDLIVSFAPLDCFRSILSFDNTTKWEENLGWAENSTMAVSTYECPFAANC